MDVPEYWFDINFELDTDNAHGTLCRGVYPGAEVHERHIVCISGKHVGFPNSELYLINLGPCCFLQIIGYICAIESLLLSGIASWPWSQYRHVPDDGSDMYIEDREMTPMSPIDSTDVPNRQQLQLQLQQQQQSQNHNNCNNSVTAAHSETNHHNQHNRTISSPTSYNNQKPYIPGKLWLLN